MRGKIAREEAARRRRYKQGESTVQQVEGLADDEDEDDGLSPFECPDELDDLGNFHSLCAQVLKENPDMYSELKNKKTENGVLITRCVKPGVDSRCLAALKISGLVAGDAECYSQFQPLFDAVIRRRHDLTDHAALDYTHDMDASQVGKVRRGGRMVPAEPLDPEGQYVRYVEIRARRNLADFPFPPAVLWEQRREVERKLVVSLLKLGGTYYPMMGSTSYEPMPGGMSTADMAALDAEELLPKDPDARLLVSAGFAREWPDARGVFKGDDGVVSAWVNYDDHLNLCVCHGGGDFGATLEQMVATLNAVEESIQTAGSSYARCARLGYLTTDPVAVGSAMRCLASVHLPELSRDVKFLKALCAERSITMVKSPDEEFTWRLSKIEHPQASGVEVVNRLAGVIREIVGLEETRHREKLLQQKMAQSEAQS